MFPEGEKLLWEGMVFLAFALVCGALVERRFCCAPSAQCRGRTALSPDVAALAWGDTAFSAQMPVVEDNGAGAWVSVSSAAQAPAPGGAEEMNRQMAEYLEEMRGELLWYAMRKYNGYVALESSYQILRDDESLLSVRFDATLNAGGSGQFSRCFTLEKKTGEILSLDDLFLPDSDYVQAISEEILRQMREQVQAGEADYFIPGGIWAEEECFQAIAPDQNFYLNAEGALVIVFDEYEVAPGSMGMPEFAIPAAALAEIWAYPEQ